jgi:hypothetical protein
MLPPPKPHHIAQGPLPTANPETTVGCKLDNPVLSGKNVDGHTATEALEGDIKRIESAAATAVGISGLDNEAVEGEQSVQEWHAADISLLEQVNQYSELLDLYQDDQVPHTNGKDKASEADLVRQVRIFLLNNKNTNSSSRYVYLAAVLDENDDPIPNTLSWPLSEYRIPKAILTQPPKGSSFSIVESHWRNLPEDKAFGIFYQWQLELSPYVMQSEMPCNACKDIIGSGKCNSANTKCISNILHQVDKYTQCLINSIDCIQDKQYKTNINLGDDIVSDQVKEWDCSVVTFEQIALLYKPEASDYCLEPRINPDQLHKWSEEFDSKLTAAIKASELYFSNSAETADQ